MQSQNIPYGNTYSPLPPSPPPPLSPPPQTSPVMSTGDWFVIQFILAIPIINIIMLLVWGFGSSDNLNRRNYCRASMIWILMAIAFYVLIAIVYL